MAQSPTSGHGRSGAGGDDGHDSDDEEAKGNTGASGRPARHFARGLFLFMQCSTALQHRQQRRSAAAAASSATASSAAPPQAAASPSPSSRTTLPWRSSDAATLRRSLGELRLALRAASSSSSPASSSLQLSEDSCDALVSAWRSLA